MSYQMNCYTICGQVQLIKKTLVEANCAQRNRLRGTPYVQLLRYAEQDASDWICPVAVIIETAAGAIAC